MRINYSQLSLRQADPTSEIPELRVGPQGIEGRAQQDRRVKSRFIGSVQPDHRLILIAEPNANQCYIGVGRRVLFMPGL
jgi:hypothetical protein